MYCDNLTTDCLDVPDNVDVQEVCVCGAGGVIMYRHTAHIALIFGLALD